MSAGQRPGDAGRLGQGRAGLRRAAQQGQEHPAPGAGSRSRTAGPGRSARARPAPRPAPGSRPACPPGPAGARCRCRIPAGTTPPGRPRPRCPLRPGAAAVPGRPAGSLRSRNGRPCRPRSAIRAAPRRARAHPGPGRRRTSFARSCASAGGSVPGKAAGRPARAAAIVSPRGPRRRAWRHRLGRARSATARTRSACAAGTGAAGRSAR